VSVCEDFTSGEVQTVVAARRLTDAQSVFIGVGRPSTAAILARMVHNPDLVLVYESGTIGAKPYRVPLSIGDGELAETADVVVSVPEMFNYWIGTGRVEVAFLGAAQVDGHRRLRPSQDPAAGGGRSAGDRRFLPRGRGDRPAYEAHVRAPLGFPHDRRLRRRTA
jgi:acyl CoA:acetate/3-ketoacid CoA transferase